MKAYKQENEMTVNKVLINGRFYTENPEMPWAEAVAIEGKDFAYVGDNEGAEAFAGGGAEIIDMKGKTIIPGLLDGHTHPATVSKTYWFVRGTLTKDKDELLANIKAFAEKYPKILEKTEDKKKGNTYKLNPNFKDLIIDLVTEQGLND